MSAKKDPRISVNKLGEYLVQADAARRRRIIESQKHPPIGRQVSAYREAQVAIIHALCTNPGTSLLQQAGALAADKSGTRQAVINRQNSAIAVEHFVSLLPKLPAHVSYVAAPRLCPHLMVAGVAVSVTPDVLIHATKGGKPCIGALKLHFPKDDDRALGAAGSQLVAVLLDQWLQANRPASRTVAPELCLSVDVFRESVYGAPRAQQRRLERVADGCAEIAARWPQL